MNSKYKSLFSNTAIFAVGNVTSKLILFLLVPLYTTVLSTSEFGTQDFFITLTELMIPVLTLGMVESVLRFAIDKDSDKAKVLTIAVRITSISSIIVVLLSPFALFFFSKELVVLFASGLIAYAFRSVFAQFSRGAGRSAVFAISGIVSTVTLAVCNLVFLLVFQWGLYGYLLAFVLSNVFSLIYLWFAAKIYTYISWSKHDKVLLLAMLAYSLPLIPNTLSWWIIGYSNRYIVRLLTNMEVVGLLSAAAKIPSVMTMISAIFQQAWQLSSAQEYDKTGKDEFYRSVWDGYSAVVFTAGSGLIMILPLIGKLLFKKEFLAATEFVPFLLAGAVLSTLTSFYGAIYMAFKKPVAGTVSTLIGAVLNVILCFALVPFLGGIGAGIATMCSYLFICLYRIIDVRKYVRIENNWFKFIANIAILIAQSAVFIWFPKDSSLYLLIIAGLFLVLFGINLRVAVSMVKPLLSERRHKK